MRAAEHDADDDFWSVEDREALATDADLVISEPTETPPDARPVMPAVAVRFAAEAIAAEMDYNLDDLVSAVRRGRPSPERAGRLDVLGIVVRELFRVHRAHEEHGTHWAAWQRLTLEAVGEALGGLSRDQVLRLRDGRDETKKKRIRTERGLCLKCSKTTGVVVGSNLCRECYVPTTAKRRKRRVERLSSGGRQKPSDAPEY